MGNYKIYLSCVLAFLFISNGCKDETIVDNGIFLTDEDKTLITSLTKEYNENIIAYQSMINGEKQIIDYVINEDGSSGLMFSDYGTNNIKANNNIDSDIPLFGVDENGYWIYSLAGEIYSLTDYSGKKVAATDKAGISIFTPQVKYDESGLWYVSFDGIKWKPLSETVFKGIEKKTSKSFSLYSSLELNDTEGMLTLTSNVGGMIISKEVYSLNTTQAWKNFLMQTDENVLLDFSYAGYMHGEVAPPDVYSLGYKIENVRDYMPAGTNYVRDAFQQIINKYNLDKGNSNAKVIIYFPEGDYILHDERDNYIDPDKTNPLATDSKGNNSSNSIMLVGGNFVIKGAGRDKTRLIMDTPNLPANSANYSSPCLIQVRNNSGLPSAEQVTKVSNITTESAKGSFMVEVASSLPFKVGDWVCLYLKDNDDELIAEELYPHAWEEQMTDIKINGVRVQDFHQIKSVDGNKITFVEPIMHKVDPKYNWILCQFPHYENIGVEDLSFVGHTKTNFKHLASWEDDGAYQFLNFVRTVNSWLRRVDFYDATVAGSIMYSSNFSAYDINIRGNRGHSAVKSFASSRVFIGKVTDRTNGKVHEENYEEDEVGQYHACGVSNESMGAVIWNVHWGLDACFESHASQPRATLIDNCKGGFHRYRTGGDKSLVPNHLDDLIIWNMCSERSEGSVNSSEPKNFNWWNSTVNSWKVMPPVIVGFHGDPITFVESQTKLIESNGQKVEPESLYEAQLKLRLGYVPAWLQALKQ